MEIGEGRPDEHRSGVREKLDRVREVLSNLGDDERFFSVDEYGPFAVKAKPGTHPHRAGERTRVCRSGKNRRAG